MDPATMMLLAAAASATSKMLGGIGEMEASKLNAFNINTDKKLNKAQAMQQSEARRAEFDAGTASNIAAFAAMGRGQSDNSVQAFLARQKEIFGEDLARSETQISIAGKKSDISSATEKRRGRNSLISSTVSALSDVGTGYSQYKQTSINTNKKVVE